MLSLGVVSVEEAKHLLRAGFKLAASAAKKDNARSYAAVMNFAAKVARMEQVERLAVKDPVEHRHVHLHVDEARARLDTICAELGLEGEAGRAAEEPGNGTG
jgi:alanine racemase